MEKQKESVRIELTEEKHPEQADHRESKDEATKLEVSELEARIAPVQVGTFF